MLTLAGNILMWLTAISALLLLVPALALVFRAGWLIEVMKRFAGWLEAGINGAARIVMWAGLAIALIQVAVVIMRYVFGINFIWLQELIVWLFGILFLMTAAAALLSDDHVRVDIFYRDAPPRRKAMVNLAGTYLFLFPVCILIVWAAGPYIYRAWDVLESSRETSGLPGVFLLKSVIPLFAISLAMAGFVMASRAVSTLLEREAG